MTRFIVLEPGETASAEALFVPDRFRWLAFFVPFLWLAFQRLFLFAILALLVQIGLMALGRVDGFAFASNALGLLFAVAVALEGPRLVVRRWTRRGHRVAGIVNASDRREAELLYYGTGAHPVGHFAKSEATSDPAQPPLFGWQDGRTLLDTGSR